MAGRGRPKIYKSAAEFGKAVKAYFDAITLVRAAKEWVDTGKRAINGRIIYEERVICGEDGNPIYRTVYLRPPTVTGLCLALGISRDTWENYFDAAKYPDYVEIAKAAKLRMEAYLEEQLITREKSLQGIIFNLQNNYGWRERKELEFGAETRKAVKTEAMTMEEKMELIRQAAKEMEDAGERHDEAQEG